MTWDDLNGRGAFTALMLFAVGVANFLQGLTALFSADYYAVPAEGLAFAGYVFWGIVLTLWGPLLVVGAYALLKGLDWARGYCAVVAVLNIVAQFAFLAAFPLWSVVVIALDVLVVYGVTTGWPWRGDAPAGAETARGEETAQSGGATAGGRRAPRHAGRGAPAPRAGDRERQETQGGREG
ncbi:DUF7144 family membrane protein [Marinactinospora thermotolerans]|uniref:DUF7144 domain-containing protein n=1 Tax=Marinactinospora thermotolerans DSM 45154 TaxID=1122192 RepID=A0A1T4KFI6_9ACTN|nr:hypothetical protein [Marinactinospora thermotolerans]SJZ41218.1 hypothetical protein SAMN02745673_00353 [Marinactinospora thermotolerans DSM 45154]